MNSVVIIAGERSGDLHGARLVRELLKLEPELSLLGIGGPKMRDAGVKTEYDISQMSIIGFLEVVRHLPFIRKALGRMEDLIEKLDPSLVILIDYPGFNLKVAKFAHKRGIPVLYYISPQVWAWGEKRIQKIIQVVDHMAVILDFERELYEMHGVPVTFVGHPLLESIHIPFSREEFLKKYDLDQNVPLLGLFPGSREQEVHRILPEMLKAVNFFVEKNPGGQVGIGVSEDLPPTVYEHHLIDSRVHLIKDAYSLMKYSSVMMVASGTATLESAIIGTPFVAVYRVSALNYFVAKRLIKVKLISLANIVAGKQVVPEFIQGEFKAKKVAETLDAILHDPGEKERIFNGFEEIRGKLGTIGASVRVAELAISLIKSHAEHPI